MIEPKRIFVDTSGWIELLLENDQHHKATSEYFRKETELQSRFFTSDYVLDETFTRLLTNQSFTSALYFKDKIERIKKLGYLTLLWTNHEVFKAAWLNFEKYSEHKSSFTDATTATFVKSLKLDEIVTLDSGFKKIGMIIKPEI